MAKVTVEDLRLKIRVLERPYVGFGPRPDMPPKVAADIWKLCEQLDKLLGIK
ncbi:MAG: hypothetical protein PHO67_08950 [Candidatus Omnitrophica bacterium]|nr:hypothetical protein [Candidatus Omnitrophota bacterium]